MPSPDNPDNARQSAVKTDATPHSSPQSVEEERRLANWDGIAAMPEFKALVTRKLRFIIAGTVFFLCYYFALPVLVGYFPQWMEHKVGPVNVAYLFAFSQFIMAWAIAAIYVKVAAGWDTAADKIINKAEGK